MSDKNPGNSVLLKAFKTLCDEFYRFHGWVASFVYKISRGKVDLDEELLIDLRNSLFEEGKSLGYVIDKLIEHLSTPQEKGQKPFLQEGVKLHQPSGWREVKCPKRDVAGAQKILLGFFINFFMYLSDKVEGDNALCCVPEMNLEGEGKLVTLSHDIPYWKLYEELMTIVDEHKRCENNTCNKAGYVTFEALIYATGRTRYVNCEEIVNPFKEFAPSETKSAPSAPSETESAPSAPFETEKVPNDSDDETTIERKDYSSRDTSSKSNGEVITLSQQSQLQVQDSGERVQDSGEQVQDLREQVQGLSEQVQNLSEQVQDLRALVLEILKKVT